VKKLQVEIVPDLWATNDPNAWMVYAEHPEGGYVTLFNGTKAECEKFVAERQPEIRLMGKPNRGGRA